MKRNSQIISPKLSCSQAMPSAAICSIAQLFMWTLSLRHDRNNNSIGCLQAILTLPLYFLPLNIQGTLLCENEHF